MFKYNHISNDDKLLEALTAQTDKTFIRSYKEMPCLYKEELLIRAIKCASIGKISFLIDQAPNVNKTDAFVEGVVRGDIAVVSFLHSREFSFQDDPFDDKYVFSNPNEVAVLNGNLEILTYLHSIGYPLTYSLMSFASINKDAVILEYLVKNNCPKDDTEAYINITGNFYFQEDFSFSEKSLGVDAYKCSRIIHNAGFRGVWPCTKNVCPFCLENKIEMCIDLWILESEGFTSSIQWLPREILDDVVVELEKGI